MFQFIKSILPMRPWDFGDYVVMVIAGTLIAIVAFLLFLVLAWVYKMIFYEFSYAESKSYSGIVLDMRYEPSSTTYNAATKSTTYHASEHHVQFETELGITDVDDEKLYQRVRIGESLTVISQAYYIKPRYWDGKWEFDGDRLISITSEKNQLVDFNDLKPTTYRGR